MAITTLAMTMAMTMATMTMTAMTMVGYWCKAGWEISYGYPYRISLRSYWQVPRNPCEMPKVIWSFHGLRDLCKESCGSLTSSGKTPNHKTSSVTNC